MLVLNTHRHRSDALRSHDPRQTAELVDSGTAAYSELGLESVGVGGPVTMVGEPLRSSQGFSGAGIVAVFDNA